MNNLGYENIIITQVKPKDLKLNQTIEESKTLCKANIISDKLMELKKLVLTMSAQNFNIYVNNLYEEDFVIAGNTLIVRYTALCFLDIKYITQQLLSSLNLLKPKYTMSA